MMRTLAIAIGAMYCVVGRAGADGVGALPPLPHSTDATAGSSAGAHIPRIRDAVEAGVQQRQLAGELERDLQLAAEAELMMHGKGSHFARTPAESRRSLQTSCPGCHCVAMHVGACDEISINHNYGSDCISDARCAYNDHGTNATCTVSQVIASACSTITDQTECDNHASCTYDSATTDCTTTTSASTCAAAAASGNDVCVAAGDCEYDSGTSDDVCEAVDAAACSAQSDNGEAACLAAGDCVYNMNEDYRITDRTDGSEWDVQLAAKLAGLSMEPSANCNDEMAENTGDEGPCTYDCENLKAQYFTDIADPAQTTRCFVYDVGSGSWPAELIQMIQTSKAWDPNDPTSTTTVADNTIYIPLDESWIIQGVSETITTQHGLVGGLPPVLPARISSGSRDAISRANVVLRGFRITSQTAPLDAAGSWYTFSSANINNDPAMRLGGAISYEGHGSRLLFERMVIDHSIGTSGGGIFVYGHFQQQPDDELLRTRIETVNCLFWANQARWMGGDMRVLDVWPVDWRVEGSTFYDSWSFLFHTLALSQNANAMNADHAIGVHDGGTLKGTPGEDSTVVFKDCLMDGTGLESSNTLMPGWGGIGIDLVFASGGWERVELDPIFQISRENVIVQNYECEFHNGFLIQNYLQGAAGLRYNSHVSNCDFLNNKGRSTTNQNTQGGITGLFDWLTVEHSRFESGGFMDMATQTGGEGGALRFEALETVTVRYSTFTENKAALGGAIAVSGPGAMNVLLCTFIDNEASRSGGAIEYKFLGALEVVSSVFFRNAVHNDAPPALDVTVRVCKFQINRLDPVQSTFPDALVAFRHVQTQVLLGPQAHSRVTAASLRSCGILFLTVTLVRRTICLQPVTAPSITFLTW